jgi:hypothetical protein
MPLRVTALAGAWQESAPSRRFSPSRGLGFRGYLSRLSSKASPSYPPKKIRRLFPRKTDRRRWCGRIVGREHTLVCLKDPIKHIVRGKNIYAGWRILACSGCSMEVSHYVPYRASWPFSDRKKPAWVTN